MESAAQSGDANPGTGPDEHDFDHQRWLELQVLSLTDGGAELAALRGELLEAAPPVYSDDGCFAAFVVPPSFLAPVIKELLAFAG